MEKRHLAAVVGLALGLAIADPAIADDQVGTLSLDGLSFITFQGYGNLTLPSGSTIKFHFGTPGPDGSVGFSIAPSDVAIGPITAEPGVTIQYALASSTSGTVQKVNGALQIAFGANVQATLARPDGAGGSATYALTFTTQTASATSADGSQTVQVDGVPVVRGANYVQLVGGATNRTDAAVGPGSAVYSVLSGSFDQIPALP